MPAVQGLRRDVADKGTWGVHHLQPSACLLLMSDGSCLFMFLSAGLNQPRVGTQCCDDRLCLAGAQSNDRFGQSLGPTQKCHGLPLDQVANPLLTCPQQLGRAQSYKPEKGSSVWQICLTHPRVLVLKPFSGADTAKACHCRGEVMCQGVRKFRAFSSAINTAQCFVPVVPYSLPVRC